MPGLFDTNLSEQEYDELGILLNQKNLSFLKENGNVYFLAGYFKKYFRDFLSQI